MKKEKYGHNLTYSSEDKFLKIVGVKHTIDTKHPQFDYVKNLIKQISPDAVIFELPSDGVDALKKRKNESLDILKKRFGERGIFFTYLNNSVEVIAGDLNYELSYTLLNKNNYSKEEIIAHKFLRNCRGIMILNNLKPLESLKVVEKIEKYGLNKEILEILEKYAQDISMKTFNDLTLKDDIRDINPAFANKNVLSKISRDLGFLRDKEMIRVILETIKKYNRVLFFVGSSHVERMKSELDSVLKEEAN